MEYFNLQVFLPDLEEIEGKWMFLFIWIVRTAVVFKPAQAVRSPGELLMYKDAWDPPQI